MSMVTGVSPAVPGGAARAVELAIGGMTCASCAARVEKKLNKLAGVTAAVNFATGTARVSFPAAMSVTELISVVGQAGYTAALPAPPHSEPAGREPAGAAGEQDGADETAARRRLLVSLALAIPVVVLAMIPPLQFRNWQWASLALASPVAVWGAWPFHRAAAVNARHRRVRRLGRAGPRGPGGRRHDQADLGGGGQAAARHGIAAGAAHRRQ